MAVISNNSDNRTLTKQNLVSVLCFYTILTKNVAQSKNNKIKLTKNNVDLNGPPKRFWVLNTFCRKYTT